MLNITRIQVPVASTFSVEGSADAQVMALGNEFDPNIPKAESNYYFNPVLLRDILRFIELPCDDAYWLWGLHGTGKTSLVKQICNRLNWPCYSINGSATLEIEDLLYQNHIKIDGSTSVELNALAKAFTYGGVFLFNEIDLVDPSRLAALNEIIAGDTLIIAGIDQVFKKHENFRFIVTANTNGSFDEETQIDCIGANSMNLSFMDRFLVNQADYLPADKEIDYLCKFAGDVHVQVNNVNESVMHKSVDAIRPIITMMVKVATESRKAAKNSADFDRPISIRGLKRWVQKTIQFHKSPNAVLYSLGQSITNAYPKHQADAVMRFCEDVFGTKFSNN